MIPNSAKKCTGIAKYWKDIHSVEFARDSQI